MSAPGCQPLMVVGQLRSLVTFEILLESSSEEYFSVHVDHRLIHLKDCDFPLSQNPLVVERSSLQGLQRMS